MSGAASREAGQKIFSSMKVCVVSSSITWSAIFRFSACALSQKKPSPARLRRERIEADYDYDNSDEDRLT